MKTKGLKRTLWAIAAVFLAVFCVLGSTFTAQKAVNAENPAVNDYSKTNIMDDLADINIALYPKNPLGKVEVIRLQEYCYSEKPFFAEYYGLFVYIYNPTEKPLKTDANSTINIASAYDAEGKPKDYESATLKYCHKTEDNRFYKFEIAGNEKRLAMAKAYAEAHEGRRRYDLVDIDLVPQEGDKIHCHNYSKTYYFSGFAKGCGETTQSESTLKCRMEGLETIELEVNHTNYRTLQFNEDNVCDSLDTVYFSVPETYFEEYGGLQKIEAEWYEYQTRPMYVTSDEKAHSLLYDYVGWYLSEDNSLEASVYWDFLYLDLDGLYVYDQCYNYRGRHICKNNNMQMDWLLPLKEDVKTRDDYQVTKEEVIKYMQDYTARFPSQNKIESTKKEYAAGLFLESVDAGRKVGYNNPTIDARESRDLVFEKDQSWWKEFWGGQKFESVSYEPILYFSQKDKATLASMSDGTFASTYYVNKADAAKVKQYCLDKLEDGERPVLFRFADTKYYASSACFENGIEISRASDGYVAQETVFLDFNIISLTFRDEAGVDTVIGVVAAPIDIINGLDPPTSLKKSPLDWDWAELLAMVLKWIFILGGIVAFCVFVLPLIMPFISAALGAVGRFLLKVLKWIGKAIIWIIVFPFNLIPKLFQRKKDEGEESDNRT